MDKDDIVSVVCIAVLGVMLCLIVSDAVKGTTFLQDSPSAIVHCMDQQLNGGK